MTDPARTTKEERVPVAKMQSLMDAYLDDHDFDRSSSEWMYLRGQRDAADALRAQVAALQAENERLTRERDESSRALTEWWDHDNKRIVELESGLAAAQAKLAVPAPADVTQITTRLESASALLGDMGYSVAGAHMYQARAIIASLARDNAALRTKAEALERERTALILKADAYDCMFPQPIATDTSAQIAVCRTEKP